jgi:hypothetical protein
MTILHLAIEYHLLLVLQIATGSQGRTSALIALGLSSRFDLGRFGCWLSLGCGHYTLVNITTSNNNVNQRTRQCRYDLMYYLFSSHGD